MKTLRVKKTDGTTDDHSYDEGKTFWGSATWLDFTVSHGDLLIMRSCMDSSVILAAYARGEWSECERVGDLKVAA